MQKPKSHHSKRSCLIFQMQNVCKTRIVCMFTEIKNITKILKTRTKVVHKIVSQGCNLIRTS